MKLLKSEKFTLMKIKELTIDQGKKNTVVTNKQFEQKGLKGRHIIIKATNALVEKGLIFKFRNDDKYFRYTMTKNGTVYVLEKAEII